MGAERKVAKGQVAGVYGLLFVGCTFKDACEALGVDRKVMRQHILPSWRDRRLPIKTRNMTAPERSVYRNLREMYGRDHARVELAKLVSPGAAAPNMTEL